MYIIHVVLGALLFGLTLWGGIKLVDRYNEYNTIPLAIIIGLFFAATSPMFGVVLMVLPLIALFYLMVNFYNLGLGQSLIVFVAMGSANVLLTEGINRLAAQM